MEDTPSTENSVLHISQKKVMMMIVFTFQKTALTFSSTEEKMKI